MGSGTRKPTARPAPKRSAIAGGDGTPVLSCPDGDRLPIEDSGVTAGTDVTLELVDNKIVIRSGQTIVSQVHANRFAELAKCLADGFEYHGEVEFEGGKSFVHFWIVG